MTNWLRVLVQRLIALFRKERLEQELDDELCSHLEMQVEENVRKGMSPQDARYAALRSFGGVEQVKEIYREQMGLPMIETLVRDVRYGLRMLAKNLGFTSVAVVTLALGIGANTAVFSIVNAVMLRPLPFPAADRLVRVLSTDESYTNSDDNASYPDVVDWRARNRVFERMAVFHTSKFTLTGAGEPLQLRGSIVSAELFMLLGVTPNLGRSFFPEEDKPGVVNGGNAVILSHGLWQRHFGSDRSVVGRTVNGGSFTVIGVMPAGFQFPIQAEPVDLWTTIAVYAQTRSGAPMTAQRGVRFLNVIARLKPDVTIAQAQAEMSAVVTALNRQYPENRPRGARVVPELDQLVGDVRPALLVFLGAVGFVLLIVCANVANLLLVRATARQKEMSIRVALGASRGRVIRQVLTESILLASFGGSLGLLLGLWGTDALIGSVRKTFPA
jgi:putative ABC transport system permease protein